MMTSEVFVILINLIVILSAYLFVCPRFAGSDFTRLLACDAVASVLSLVIVGAKFWGTGHAFSVIVANVNWFWFALISYAIIEAPIAYWYIKRHRVKLP